MNPTDREILGYENVTRITNVKNQMSVRFVFKFRLESLESSNWASAKVLLIGCIDSVLVGWIVVLRIKIEITLFGQPPEEVEQKHGRAFVNRVDVDPDYRGIAFQIG